MNNEIKEKIGGLCVTAWEVISHVIDDETWGLTHYETYGEILDIELHLTWNETSDATWHSVKETLK